jgi:hypothetical protein
VGCVERVVGLLRSGSTGGLGHAANSTTEAFILDRADPILVVTT